MSRASVAKSYARRMEREAAYAARLAAQVSLTKLDARAGAQRVVDEAAKGEYLRAIRRAQRMVGARVPASPGRLAGVLERYRVDDPRRAKTTLVSAMTAARTAGMLDVLTTLAAKKSAKRKTTKKRKKKKTRLVKEWVAVGDDKTCDECDAMDGTRANAYRDFRLGDDEPNAADYHGDSIEGPPLHPNCRCEILIDRA